MKRVKGKAGSLRRQIGTLILVFGALAAALPAAHAEDSANYVLDTQGRRILIPLTYVTEEVKNNFGDQTGQLSNPQDMFIDAEDNLYIADTGNNRIVRLNAEGEVTGTFLNEENGGFSQPNGVYVDGDGDMYVADTENGRIVHLAPDGGFVEEFTEPDSPMYDPTYGFKPLKVGIDHLGQIFILNKDDYHGFLVLDANSEFKGYLYPNKVEYTLVDMFVRMIATPEQKEILSKKMPPAHSNFEIQPDGTLYVTTLRAKSQQLSRFSASGKNIFPNKGFFGETQADSVLDRSEEGTYEPEFVDVTVSDSGIVSILDQVSGKIYQYDPDGMLLTVFGGAGNWAGHFIQPVSIAQDSQGRIYVLDALMNAYHVFKPTQFIEKVYDALDLYYDGKYDEALEPWQEILRSGNDYPVAYIGLGKTYLKQGLWDLSMEAYHAADDTAGYTQAFNGKRQEVMQGYFGLVAIGILLVITGLAAVLVRLRRRVKKGIKFRHYSAEACAGILFEPAYGFQVLKDRSKKRRTFPLVLLLAVIVVRIISVFLLHYPIAGKDPINTDFTMEITIMLAVAVTWIIGHYLVTTICEGDCFLREVVALTGYSLLPYTITAVPLALLSRCLGADEKPLYEALTTLVIIWCCVLMLYGIYSMNRYSLKETIKVVFWSVIACIFIWSVIGLMVILAQKLFGFLSEIVLEYTLWFRSN